MVWAGPPKPAREPRALPAQEFGFTARRRAPTAGRFLKQILFGSFDRQDFPLPASLTDEHNGHFAGLPIHLRDQPQLIRTALQPSDIKLPNRHTAIWPAPKPFGQPFPACRAGSRICGECRRTRTRIRAWALSRNVQSIVTLLRTWQPTRVRCLSTSVSRTSPRSRRGSCSGRINFFSGRGLLS